MSEEVTPTGTDDGSLKLVHTAPTDKKKRKAKALDDLAKEEFRTVLAGGFSPWPALGRTFKVIEDEHGAQTYIEIGAGGLCHYVSAKAIANALIAYSRLALRPLDPTLSLVLPPHTAEELTRQWAACEESFDLDTVAPVRLASEPGLCWQRLSFDLAAGDTPTFDELFAKASNVKAIMQWIGSLFDPDSPREQYIFLWGDGLDGKGSLLYFLKEIFGPTYKAEIPSTNQFWSMGLLGKRVIALDDLSHSDIKFLTSSTFKGLTGGGALRVEEKQGASSDGDFVCKVIVTSNHKPKIEGSKADLRRIIYSEFEPRTVAPTVDFKKRLVLEAPAFLWRCREAYGELPAGAWVPTDSDAIEAVINDHEEKFQHIFDKYFIANAAAHTAAFELRVVLVDGEEITDTREQSAFKHYIERKYGVKKKKLVRGGAYFYMGIEVLQSVRENTLKAALERGAGPTETVRGNF